MTVNELTGTPFVKGKLFRHPELGVVEVIAHPWLGNDYQLRVPVRNFDWAGGPSFDVLAVNLKETDASH